MNKSESVDSRKRNRPNCRARKKEASATKKTVRRLPRIHNKDVRRAIIR
jgi:hypothetical protein